MTHLEGSEGKLLVVLHAGRFALPRAQGRQAPKHLLRLCLHHQTNPSASPCDAAAARLYTYSQAPMAQGFSCRGFESCSGGGRRDAEHKTRLWHESACCAKTAACQAFGKTSMLLRSRLTGASAVHAYANQPASYHLYE